MVSTWALRRMTMGISCCWSWMGSRVRNGCNSKAAVTPRNPPTASAPGAGHDASSTGTDVAQRSKGKARSSNRMDAGIAPAPQTLKSDVDEPMAVDIVKDIRSVPGEKKGGAERPQAGGEDSGEPTPKERRHAAKRKTRGSVAAKVANAEANNGDSENNSSTEPPALAGSRASAAGAISDRGTTTSDPKRTSKRSHKTEEYVAPEEHFTPFPGADHAFPCVTIPRPTGNDTPDWRCGLCRTQDSECIFFPLVNSTCEVCKTAGKKCDLGDMSAQSSGFLAGYCAFRAGVQLANPHIYPNPVIRSAVWSLEVDSAKVPTWFKTWRRVQLPTGTDRAAKRREALLHREAASLHRNDVAPIEDLGEAAVGLLNYLGDPPALEDSEFRNDSGEEEESDDEPIFLQPPAKKSRTQNPSGSAKPPAHAVASRNQPPPPPHTIEELRSRIAVRPPASSASVPRAMYDALVHRVEALEREVARMRGMEVEVARMRGQLDGMLHPVDFGQSRSSGSLWHGSRSPSLTLGTSAGDPVGHPVGPGSFFSTGGPRASLLSRATSLQNSPVATPPQLSAATSPSPSALGLPPSTATTASRSASVSSSREQSSGRGASPASTRSGA
ncbi:uncharacterized protein BXZ73DRAFT_78033 [Epithele typhae]|uniref:uncharacterized protein n=1 Tax=Epithele typhae TaxID=378194 RepID=UPI002008698C|nr:uncharacterized protein BXZ73DRAFT_78033 [Epithele typhae]KAH9929928.1 hypothetical protein BXZ73DRAFT_78033 [Epithele typhae]